MAWFSFIDVKRGGLADETEDCELAVSRYAVEGYTLAWILDLCEDVSPALECVDDGLLA